MWIGKEAVSNPFELGRWKEACRGAVILAKVLIYWTGKPNPAASRPAASMALASELDHIDVRSDSNALPTKVLIRATPGQKAARLAPAGRDRRKLLGE